MTLKVKKKGQTEAQKNETVKKNSIMVKAMSEHHAQRVASGLVSIGMELITGVTTIKPPRQAKTCRTHDNPVKGTRKWKTVYEVYAYGEKVPLGRDQYHYINMELVQSDIDTKTEAMKVAREMAVKHQLPMTIQIAQKLATHSPTTADVEPKTTQGEYEVFFIEK